MIKTFINAWKVADLRKKILFTALIILIFRIGAAIPVPFIVAGGIQNTSELYSGTFIQYLNMMTGNAFNMGTIFALSISPYINASIIIQLLTVAIPYLEKLSKDGEEGRKKISKITRYTTVGLAAMQSVAYYIYLRSQNAVVAGKDGAMLSGFPAVFAGMVIVFCLTAGSTLIMWLGEQVNEHGIGNGISIILFAGIVARVPTMCVNIYQYFMSAKTVPAYYALTPVLIIGL
ncbi:MAG: preprotein translocase subunit SecY, partial [Acutalibacteraceae bacterium]